MDKEAVISFLISIIIGFVLVTGVVLLQRCQAEYMMINGTACVNLGGQYICNKYNCVCLPEKKK